MPHLPCLKGMEFSPKTYFPIVNQTLSLGYRQFKSARLTHALV